jgi:hypothetical protein
MLAKIKNEVNRFEEASAFSKANLDKSEISHISITRLRRTWPNYRGSAFIVKNFQGMGRSTIAPWTQSGADDSIHQWSRYVAYTAEPSYTSAGSNSCTFAVNADERHCSLDTGQKTSYFKTFIRAR